MQVIFRGRENKSFSKKHSGFKKPNALIKVTEEPKGFEKPLGSNYLIILVLCQISNDDYSSDDFSLSL
jgi:hypothetical protein